MSADISRYNTTCALRIAKQTDVAIACREVARVTKIPATRTCIQGDVAASAADVGVVEDVTIARRCLQQNIATARGDAIAVRSNDVCGVDIQVQLAARAHANAVVQRESSCGRQIQSRCGSAAGGCGGDGAGHHNVAPRACVGGAGVARHARGGVVGVDRDRCAIGQGRANRARAQDGVGAQSRSIGTSIGDLNVIRVDQPVACRDVHTVGVELST